MRNFKSVVNLYTQNKGFLLLIFIMQTTQEYLLKQNISQILTAFNKMIQYMINLQFFFHIQIWQIIFYLLLCSKKFEIMRTLSFYFIACTDDSHCFCPPGLAGKCYFNIFERSYSCVCGMAMGNVILSIIISLYILNIKINVYSHIQPNSCCILVFQTFWIWVV